MNAWIKRKNHPGEVVRVIHDMECRDANVVYNLHTAFGDDDLGRILFDEQRYWIYDGEELSVAEQEQLAGFIMHHTEVLWNS